MAVAHPIASAHRALPVRLPRLLLAALAIGTLDMAVASAYWAVEGVAPSQLFQAIAAWLLGREAAFGGGAATVAFGAGLHYALMAAWVALYAAAVRRHAWLGARPLRNGALYGAALYGLVFVVLVPNVSAAPPVAPPRLDWMLTCLLAYVVLVGIGSALAARGNASR